MRVVVLYHPHSEQAGPVEDFAREYHMRHGDITIEKVSLESREGDHLAKLYDVTNYPAVMVIVAEGTLQKIWIGGLPMIEEVEAYVRS